MLFSVSKESCSILAPQAMLMTDILSPPFTPRDKTKSNALAGEKVRNLLESVVSFLSSPMSLRRMSFHSQRPTSIKAWSKMNRDHKSASWNNKHDLEVSWCIEDGRHTFKHYWSQNTLPIPRKSIFQETSYSKKSYSALDIPRNPCPPTYILISISHPLSYLSHPHLLIICNKNKMAMTFLVQMRQSDKYGTVRNVKIINFHLGSGAGLSASIPWLLQDPSHI